MIKLLIITGFFICFYKTYKELYNLKWFRKMKGGKWWLCYDSKIMEKSPFWIHCLNKPEEYTIIDYEDYDKILN